MSGGLRGRGREGILLHYLPLNLHRKMDENVPAFANITQDDYRTNLAQLINDLSLIGGGGRG